MGAIVEANSRKCYKDVESNLHMSREVQQQGCLSEHPNEESEWPGTDLGENVFRQKLWGWDVSGKLTGFVVVVWGFSLSI